MTGTSLNSNSIYKTVMALACSSYLLGDARDEILTFAYSAVTQYHTIKEKSGMVAILGTILQNLRREKKGMRYTELYGLYVRLWIVPLRV